MFHQTDEPFYCLRFWTNHRRSYDRSSSNYNLCSSQAPRVLLDPLQTGLLWTLAPTHPQQPGAGPAGRGRGYVTAHIPEVSSSEPPLPCETPAVAASLSRMSLNAAASMFNQLQNRSKQPQTGPEPERAEDGGACTRVTH